MTAEQIYAVLDRAGLTPPVHFLAAPYEWRVALREIETEIEDSRDRAITAVEAEFNGDIDSLEKENAKLSAAMNKALVHLKAAK